MSNISDPLQLDIGKEIRRCRKEDIGYMLFTDDQLREHIIAEREAEKQKQTKPQQQLKQQLKTNCNDIYLFLKDTFQNLWGYNQEQLDQAEPNMMPEMISPLSIDWEHRKQDIDASKSGQYTLNPETQVLDFERARVFIPSRNDLKQLEGRTFSEVAGYITKTYGTRYYIPGIEYWQYISQNPDKAPQELKETKNYYFYFGSILRYRDGNWIAPYSYWDSSSFNRIASWLSSDWGFNYRVVLLEK